MKKSLQIVGSILVLFGVANIIGMPWANYVRELLILGLMFNILLFIIPGLVLYKIGTNMQKSQHVSHEGHATTKEPVVKSSELSIEERLILLNNLKEKSLISEAEYNNQRSKILNVV